MARQRQHPRARAQGPVPGGAPGQGQGLVLLTSQESSSPCSRRAFWSEVTMILPFKTFFFCINKDTLSQAEEFLSPNPAEGCTYQGPYIILSPSLARWILDYFYKAVTSIAIKVLKHVGALPSFTICLLLRKSIYGLKKTQYNSQFTMQLGTLIKLFISPRFGLGFFKHFN